MEHLPKSIEDYLAAARTKSALPSDNALASALGITRQSLSQIRAGILMPGDALMLKLAEMARENPQLALLQLQAWKAKDQVTKAAWLELAHAFKRTAAALILAFVFAAFLASPAEAAGRTYAPDQCILWKI